MEPDPAALARELIARCRSLGFAGAGVTDIRPSRWSDALVSWLERGHHGTMEYLRETLEARLDPTQILAGARSVIVVIDQYAARGSTDAALISPTPIGRIARYARGRDYHGVMKRRLHVVCDEFRDRFPPHEFRAVVDTAPFLEREHAANAGLGWIGKHTLLIHPKLGSYVFIGAILTTLPLEPTPDLPPVADHCGTCTRCIDACPTQAITPYSVNASRCISYLTIEHRDDIDQSLQAAMSDWIYGCDICQEVCPHNSIRPDGSGTDVNSAYGTRAGSIPVADILGWDENARRDAFSTSPMKRATLAMMKRNAAIAAGNWLMSHVDAPLRTRLDQIARDETEDPMVRRSAAAALARSGGPATHP